jgi:hypothetical protein
MAMTTHSDDHFGRDLRSDYDHNLRRARLAGYVLLAGLFLEVVSGIIWFHGVETLASVVGIALVAGGVSGEIFFENRARLADKGTRGAAAPPIGGVQQPEPGYNWTSVRGVQFSVGPGELLRHTPPSPNNSRLPPPFPERARRNLPPRRWRETALRQARQAYT